jgi:hypothetical protein
MTAGGSPAVARHDRQMVDEKLLMLRRWERFSGQTAGRLDG